MSSARKEAIIKKGFIKSLIDGTLEIKDLAGINIDLDIARQAYLQGVLESTQVIMNDMKGVLESTQDIMDDMKTVLETVATDDSVSKAKMETIDILDASDDSTVEDSGGTDSVLVYAPAGYIYEILGLMFWCQPPDGGTGAPNYHYAEIRSSGGTGIEILKLSSYGDDELNYNYGEVITATKERFPSSDAIALQNIRGYRIDENRGLTIVYVNNTNAEQTHIRLCRIWVRKIQVA